MLVVGTLDTKGDRAALHTRHHRRTAACARGWSTSRPAARHSACDVSAQEIALNHGRGGPSVFGADRGASVTAMADAFAKWMRRQGNIAGIISAGGSGGTSLVAPAHARPAHRRAEDHRSRRWPPATSAPMSDLRHHDDVFGHRRAGPQFDLARRCSPTARRRMLGMVKARLDARKAGDAAAARRPSRDRPHHVRRHDACVQKIAADLNDDYECLVFHATGVGGQLDGEAGRLRPAGRRHRSSPRPKSATS